MNCWGFLYFIKNIYCYLIIDVVLLGLCIASGLDIKSGITMPQICNVVYDITMFTGTTKDVLIYVVIMPVVVSIAISIAQMTISLCASPMIGFVIVQIMAICATFSVSGFAIHNYGALAHTSICCPSNITYKTGIVVCAMVAIVSVILGNIYFDKCNILAKETDGNAE